VQRLRPEHARQFGLERFGEQSVDVVVAVVDELGKPVVMGGDGRFQMVLPPMKIRDFNFTSLSDAV
jgi:hypothetical protein